VTVYTPDPSDAVQPITPPALQPSSYAAANGPEAGEPARPITAAEEFTPAVDDEGKPDTDAVVALAAEDAPPPPDHGTPTAGSKPGDSPGDPEGTAPPKEDADPAPAADAGTTAAAPKL